MHAHEMIMNGGGIDAATYGSAGYAIFCSGGDNRKTVGEPVSNEIVRILVHDKQRIIGTGTGIILYVKDEMIWILTAAHCVMDLKTNDFYPQLSIQWKPDGKTTAFTCSVFKSVVHPNWIKFKDIDNGQSVQRCAWDIAVCVAYIPDTISKKMKVNIM